MMQRYMIESRVPAGAHGSYAGAWSPHEPLATGPRLYDDYRKAEQASETFEATTEDGLEFRVSPVDRLAYTPIAEIPQKVRSGHRRGTHTWPTNWAAALVERIESLRRRRRDHMSELRALLYELECTVDQDQLVAAERTFVNAAIELVEWHLAGHDDEDPERCTF